MATSLSRSEFDIACKCFLKKQSTLAPTAVSEGWSWKEHIVFPGLGYMFRRVVLLWRDVGHALPSDVGEDFCPESADDATMPSLPSLTRERLECHQYVVYSPTFQVPTFYFTIHDTNGSPLPLTQIVKTSLFRSFAFQGMESSPFGLTHPASTFPLLSQGDHPTLGIPAWFFHPCETAVSVGEVMAEFPPDVWTHDQWLVRWLEAWFMILGTVVDLRD